LPAIRPKGLSTPRIWLARFSYGGSGDQVLFRLPCCEWGPGRIMVLSAVGMCRRMMVSEALAS
jgi:hypothetical protein